MPKRKILLLAVAGGVAIVTVLMARSMMHPSENGSLAVSVPSTEVMAAARDLPTGTILKEIDVKWIPWSADAETGKLYVKGKAEISTIVGAVLRQGLHADEPIVMGRVVQSHEQGFLAAVLEPGKRAVSVTLTPSAGVAGFIFPGDHVDVILTHSFSRKDIPDLTERRVSETVVADARVLALDQKSDDQSTDPKIAQLATLEVTPKQAERVALAIDLVTQTSGGRGSITLALRSLATQETAAPTGTAAGMPVLNHETGPTWDADVSSGLPAINGDDRLVQKVHVMRGKETVDSSFERHR